jgi:hypothetical protein
MEKGENKKNYSKHQRVKYSLQERAKKGIIKYLTYSFIENTFSYKDKCENVKHVIPINVNCQEKKEQKFKDNLN